MHVELSQADPLAALTQDNDDSSAISAFQSFWFIKSDNLGKVSVGQQSPASDNTAILVDGSGSLVPANWVPFDNQAFFLKFNGQRATINPPGPDNTYTRNWGDLQACNFIGRQNTGAAGDCGGQAGPGNYVRYDSPTYAGFSVSADWGEDDIWDVAARYAGEHGGFKVAVAGSYAETTDTSSLGADIEVSYWQIGGYVEHTATGVFVYGAYGKEETDGLLAAINGPVFQVDDSDTWYIKAGLRERWTPLGHTVLYGEYKQTDDAADPGAWGTPLTGSEFRHYGAGVVQEIDSAAMSLWISWRHFEGEVDCAGGCSLALEGPNAFGTSFQFDDMDIVKAGALINF
jgi:hypothetical protein